MYRLLRTIVPPPHGLTLRITGTTVTGTFVQISQRTTGDQRVPDTTDLQILRILEANGRATNREIAEQVGVSEGTVRNRIDRMVRDEVLRIVGVANPQKLGLTTTAVIAVSCELPRLADVADRIAAVENIVYVGYTTGTADLICLGFFPSTDALTDFLTGTLAGIQGITKVETSIILKSVRSLFPGARGLPTSQALRVAGAEG